MRETQTTVEPAPFLASVLEMLEVANAETSF